MKITTPLLVLALILSPSLLMAQKTDIFVLGYGDKNFVSLTGAYNFSESYENSVIEEKYLKVRKGDSAYYHQLSPKNRKIFFERINISNSDQLYLYNYVEDTLITREVKNLKLIAKLSAYGFVGSSPSKHVFMIGFVVKGDFFINWETPYSNTLVCIGNKNPFITGKLKRMKWKKTERRTFPYDPEYKSVRDWLKKYCREESFKFETEKFEYYLQNLYLYDSLNNSRLEARHLVVKGKKTNAIVFNKVYMDGEAASLSAIGLKAKPQQWTGKLFKNKPPVVFNFLYYTFGCPSIYFLTKEEDSRRILCDNRH